MLYVPLCDVVLPELGRLGEAVILTWEAFQSLTGKVLPPGTTYRIPQQLAFTGAAAAADGGGR